MRSLAKTGCPAVLAANGAQWTAVVISALANGQSPTETQKKRYNHPQIKSALKAETFDKCAYCESKITHIDHGDIEHIIPKSKVPAQAFDWDNLTLACRICNQNKGDFYSGGNDHTGLVDPYTDNPADHFLFHRESVTPRPDSVKGLLTEDQIGISRGPLRERRAERMDFIDDLIRGYYNASAAEKPILKRNIYKRCCADDSEYSAIAKRYVDSVFAQLGI